MQLKYFQNRPSAHISVVEALRLHSQKYWSGPGPVLYRYNLHYCPPSYCVFYPLVGHRGASLIPTMIKGLKTVACRVQPH